MWRAGSLVCLALPPERDSYLRTAPTAGFLLGTAAVIVALHVATGAAASSAPDLEHVLPFLRPGGRKLFHDRGWHRSGRFPAGLQLLLAGAILGALIAPRSRAV